MSGVHLVFPPGFEALEEELRRVGIPVSGRDYNLEQFHAGVLSGSVHAPVAFLYGPQPEQSVASYLRLVEEIRIRKPNLRLIFVFGDLSRDREIIEGLVSLGVYDIHIRPEFEAEEVREWVSRPRTIAYARLLLAGVETPDGEEAEDAPSPETGSVLPPPQPTPVHDAPPKKRGLFRRRDAGTEKKSEEKPGLFARLFSRKKRDEAPPPPPPPPPSPPPAVRDGVLVFADPAVERAVRKAGFRVVSDPRRALLAVATPDRAAFAPSDLPLLILRTGAASDVLIAARYPNARLIAEEELENELRALLEEPAPEPERPAPVFKPEPEASPQAEPAPASSSPTVPPSPPPSSPPPPPPDSRSPEARSVRVISGKGKDDRLTVPGRGVIYVVSPGDPGLAGETAARIARALPKSALVCAGGMSTAAIALGIPEAVLVEADWRIPGAKAPLEKDGITVWPVDPEKFLDVRDALPNALVSQIRSRFAVTVVDAAGDLTLTAGAPRNAVVIVLKSGSELVDRLTDRWLREHGKNALVVLPHETVRAEPFGDGALVRKIGRFSAAALGDEN
ncbi:hypothetical protein [Hydrogenibacillus schlegelii]|nr:hypothetical protein [Hydrogenibacillus schlegelii]